MSTNQDQCLPGSGIPGQEANNYCAYYIPVASNVTEDETAALKTCCAPNPVQIYDGCGQWCQVPDRVFQNVTTQGSNSIVAAQSLTADFNACLLATNPQPVIGASYCSLPRLTGYTGSASSLSLVLSGGLANGGLLLPSCLVLCFWILSP
jgi:hypothetical protein